MKDAALLLDETLQEEIKTDQLLTKLATPWSTKNRPEVSAWLRHLSTNAVAATSYGD